MQHKCSRGITLIELMIAVAIVAILASLAYPSYEGYVRKGRRATAQAALQELAARQHQFLLNQRRYARRCDTCTAAEKAREIPFALPAELAGFYTLHANGPDASYLTTSTSFAVTAIPSEAMAARGEQTMSIDQRGRKTPAEPGYWGR
jgi:type IV pilus assembly protein PilE